MGLVGVVCFGLVVVYVVVDIVGEFDYFVEFVVGVVDWVVVGF